MKQTILLAMLLFWAGKYNTTMLGGTLFYNCEFSYGAQTIWLSFENQTCPSSIEI